MHDKGLTEDVQVGVQWEVEICRLDLAALELNQGPVVCSCGIILLVIQAQVPGKPGKVR